MKSDMRKRRQARVRGKVVGTSARPRLCVFRSNGHIYAQVIDDSKGVTLCAASTLELKGKYGGNKEAALAVGELIAKKCKEAKIKTVVFDRNGYIFHGRVAAVAEGARKGGLDF